MNRTGRRLLLAGSLALLAAGGLWAFLGRGPARPNIVLIVWDTARADRVEVNGYPHPTTPNLVRFAAEGTTFRQCFSSSPWTPPSHASMFTGLLPRNHGLQEGKGDRVRSEIPLLAETLRAAGYDTASFVSNPQLTDVTGLTSGFDHRVECIDSKVPGAKDMDVAVRVTQWLDGRGGGWGRKPLFLFVNLMQTHIPYAATAGDVEAVRGKDAVAGALKAAARVNEDVAAMHLTGVELLPAEVFPALSAAYDGSVRAVDRDTGTILDRLRARGILDDAVVVVCGDHGENLGEHGALGHVQSLSEQVLHVPLVIRWPGHMGAGVVENAQVRLQDLYPTLMEATGVAIPPHCGADATSLTEKPLRSRVNVAMFGPARDRFLGLLKINPDASPKIFEQMYRAFLAVREPSDRPGARKYTSLVRTTIGGPSELLHEGIYDLAADPGEEKNLLTDDPSPPVKADLERLRALGGK